MRNAAGKVMWVGRATVFMVGLAVILALVLGVASTALSATGATFILGKGNSATTPTSLVSTMTDATKAALSVTNKSGGPALSLGVLSGKAPIKVSATAGTATNLSADKLDGKDSTEFLGNTDKAADAAHADRADHATTAESATSANSAGDANTLDGKDSTEFLGKSEKAADSDTLDGLDSIALQRRVSTACESGSSIRAISEDGTPTCEPDDDTSADQVNALKTELGTNDNAPNQPSDPVSYSKIKDVPANIATRDADTLDGKDSAAFLGTTQKAADSDMLDGKDSLAFAAAYKRTVVVSPVGTDTQNGQALLDALSSIKDASATKKYLLYIEPGTYNLGSGTLQMKQHVDIQGAGELNTLITSHVSTPCPSQIGVGNPATLMGKNNAELRFLTVQHTGTGPCSIAIMNDSASPRLTHVTAKATSSESDHYGVWNSHSDPTMSNLTATASGGSENYGVYNDFSNPTMTNLTATASGGEGANLGVFNVNSPATMSNLTATGSGGAVSYGVLNVSSDATMTNLTATASGGADNTGVDNRDSDLTIRQSKLSGSTTSLRQSFGGTAKIALTQFVGPIRRSDGALQCFNNYNENLAAVTCP